MNDYILIGQIVNTHGLKGEIRIISDFELKTKVLAPLMTIYIGDEKEAINITGYRHHRMFDMVFLENKNKIEDVLKYKGKFVYYPRKDLDLKDSDYLLQEIIGFEIVEDEKTLGKIIEIVYNSKQVLLKVKKEKEFYIPFLDEYIVKVDNIGKKVYTKNAKDLML